MENNDAGIQSPDEEDQQVVEQHRPPSHDASPSRSIDGPASSSITIVSPFDIGVSYVFHARSGGWKSPAASLDEPDSLPTREEVGKAWRSIFNGSHWNTDRLPPRFDNPLGQIASLGVPTDGELIKKLPWMDQASLSAEALFLPFGIGAFVVRGRLEETTTPATALDHFWKTRETCFGSNFAQPLNEAAQQFRDALAAEAGKTGSTIHRLKDISELRNQTIDKAAYSYPIVFTGDEQGYKEIRQRIRSREGKRRKGKDHIYCDGESSARMCAGWQEACVLNASEKLRENIDFNFLIAMVSWYALLVMNKMASVYLLQAVDGLATGTARTISKKSRTIRLAFMDTANASHPIRWATQQEDLALLESIHAAWNSERLWKNIDERTYMLSTHHDELEAEESELKQKRLAIFAFAIACLTLASAVADIIQLLPGNGAGSSWFKDNGWWFSILVPVLIGTAIYLYYNREKLSAMSRPSAKRPGS